MSKDILNKIRLKNGEELVLREPNVEDAEAMIKYLNTVGGESDNLLFGKDEFRLTVEQEREYLKNVSNDVNTLMVLGIIDDTIISVSHLSASNRKRIAHNSEMSISVKKEYWGMGIGSAVMTELINFAKTHENIKTISLGVKASNKTAIKLYEKFGFERVGMHKNFFNINGEFDDEYLMDLYL
ncbi:GNAT family N-acetyltransferase [Clostridium sp. 'White wine YQ']|uniref:GNAT family N-acetyltransferase n=1 Tax=Clostridium sp. 'White wine YQ' TaxID=3027474 RepID=UPI002365A07E|nr:GNAT family N-acetyltransferase [Clostridium sp. 'White wine YQ']MDD7793167.1 GNAT family N-acetyltransferase [Clostridium sp. 'White wine YQ']